MIELPSTNRKKPRPPYRKPEAIRELERMSYADDQRRHPSIAREYLARRTFRDDTANALTKAICTYISLRGGFASRVNNGGIYDTKLKRFRHSTSKRGLPDIIATWRGMSLFVEVKAGRDRMSQWQKAVRNDQQQAGGLYYLARNFTDFKTWFDGIELIHASIGSTQ